MCLNVHKCCCDCTRTCTFGCLCVTACLLGGPGARGTWPVAFPAEEGAGAAVRKRADEERDLLSAEDQP